MNSGCFLLYCFNRLKGSAATFPKLDFHNKSFMALASSSSTLIFSSNRKRVGSEGGIECPCCSQKGVSGELELLRNISVQVMVSKSFCHLWKGKVREPVPFIILFCFSSWRQYVFPQMHTQFSINLFRNFKALWRFFWWITILLVASCSKKITSLWTLNISLKNTLCEIQ